MKHPVPERLPSAPGVLRSSAAQPSRPHFPMVPAHRPIVEPLRALIFGGSLFQALVSAGAQTRRLLYRAERTSSAYLKPRRVP